MTAIAEGLTLDGAALAELQGGFAVRSSAGTT